MNLLIAALFLTGPASDAPDIEPAHAKNATYLEVLRSGLRAGAATVTLPPPVLRDGDDAARQRKALAVIAGSERARDDLLRDSVTAPFVLKVRDVKTEGAIIRVADLWFVVRGDLAALDPERVAEQAGGKAVEVGNMRFESRVLTAEEVKSRGQGPEARDGASSWFVHLTGRLLDRIAVSATDRVTATRSDDSMVVAARTDPAFDADEALANRWSTLSRDGASGPPQPFTGGVSYAKISRLREPAGALLVELHAAFSEPEAWFQGAPILRSKFAPIAQDQIRQLRRELTTHRTPNARPPAR